MNIPQGYKQTELGIIPEDWEIQSFSQVFDMYPNNTYPRDCMNDGHGTIRNIHYGDVLIKYPTVVDVDKCSIPYLNEGIKIKTQKFVQSGDVIIADTAEDETVGKSVEIKNAINAKIVAGLHTFFCRPIRTFAIGWLGYYLNSSNYHNQLLPYITGIKVSSISRGSIQETKLLVPPVAEQRAIAEALSDIDGLIAALDKKIAKKRLIKQGAMQQLLTGKKRLLGFTGDWIEIRLGDYTAMNSGGTPSSSIPEYYNGDIPFLSISDITISGKYIKKTEKTITKKGLKNSSARMFPRGTIMYAMYASLGKTSIADIELSCSQAILGITPNDKIDSNYLYYCLSFIENNVKEIGQTGTQTNLSKQIVQDFLLYIPNQGNEQQAIATILTDMDKEIADLETKCDKYRLLKLGMMQKLLTGQIRLTKQRAKVVPLVPELSAAREIPVDAHILAGHIVNRLWQSKGWGRTKLQKSLHLVGYCVQLNLGNEYIRNTAGPDDQGLMNYIDQKFKQYRHVNIKKERRSDGTVHYSYIPTPLIQELEMAYEQYPQNIREHIDVLLDKLSTTNLAGAEILSTLYAVWNNRIIKGEQITDDLLLADFYAWSQHKADFEERRVRNALDYMRKENIVPIGWGKYIDKGKSI